LHQAVEELLRDRATVDVVDSRRIEGLRIVSDGTVVCPARLLAERRSRARDEEEADGDHDADRREGPLLSGVWANFVSSERGG